MVRPVLKKITQPRQFISSGIVHMLKDDVIDGAQPAGTATADAIAAF